MADVFQSIDGQGATTVAAIAERLEMRGDHDGFVAMRGRYFDRLDFSGARRVLDLGCGTGVVTRALADRVGGDCELVGSDLSARLIDRARDLAAEAGLGERIRFEVADSQGTEDAGGRYDIVIAHTLVSHVDDPAAVLAEAVRLARPGGQVAIFDGDYASLAVATNADAADARAVAGLLATVVANPAVLRNLPVLAAAAGLRVEDVLADVLVEVGQAPFFLAMARAYVPPAIAGGHLDATAAQDWMGRVERASAGGTLFGSCNYLTYLMRRGG